MVFSSIPAYLDPANWQQQPNHQTAGNSTHQLTSSQQQLPPPPPPQTHHVGVGMGSIRPGSMAERARLANIPLPEPALKCPRCESTNTKFCYFNNYSLSQPRHFCKTCRRYWTRGGALRNVPVGGGCRRNKRTKASSSSTSSKSPASSDRQTTNNSSSTSTVNSSTSISGTANILGLTPQIPPLRFLSPLSQFTDNYGGDIGLNYSGISAPVVGSAEMNFQLGTNFLGSSNNIGLGGGGAGMASVLLSSGIEQWRNLQQFPNNFLGGLDSYGQQFQGSGNFVGEASTHDHQVRAPNNKLSSSMLTQMASIKMEDNNQGLNLRRQLMGAAPENIPNNDQWNGGGGAWTDLSSFSSSSTSNPI